MKRIWKLSTKKIVGLVFVVLFAGTALAAAHSLERNEMLGRMVRALWDITWTLFDSERAHEMNQPVSSQAFDQWARGLEEVLAETLPAASHEDIVAAIQGDLLGKAHEPMIKVTTLDLAVVLYVINDPCHALKVVDLIQPVAPVFSASLEARLGLKEQCRKAGPVPQAPNCAPANVLQGDLLRMPHVVRLFLTHPSSIFCSK